MILKNKNGIKKEFKILLEVKNNKKNYLIYEDELNNNIYCGKVDGENLKALNKEEFEYMNKVIKKF